MGSSSASGWMRSDREDGVAWQSGGPMKEADIEPLLKKFGLDEVFGHTPRPPLEKLRHLSPAKLVAMRRGWERKFDKPTLAVLSDTGGCHLPAEEFGDAAREPASA